MPAVCQASPSWHHPYRVSHLQPVILCGKEVLGEEVAPDTISGYTMLIDVPDAFVQTQRIPAFDGVHFGILIAIVEESDTYATITVEHPPMGQQRATRESWQAELDAGGVSWNGYQVFLVDGNPIGTWTFTVTTPNDVIAKTTFEVFEPQTDTVNPCVEFPSS